MKAGEGYMTPKAFDKNKKSTGANDIYYYKLGYKPVPKKIKGSGLEVKQLFEKEELTDSYLLTTKENPTVLRH